MTGQTSGKHSLQRVGDIHPTLLWQDAYFESLMQAAYDAGLVGEDEAQRIQMDCFYLLAEKTKKYTSGSSSFEIDDGENIMQSNAYTIGLYLKSLPTPLDAIEAVKVTPVAQLYTLGQQSLCAKLAACQGLYHQVLQSLTKVSHTCYISTLTDAVQQFFDLYVDYWTWYNAHMLPKNVKFRYPIYCGDYVTGFVGVEYVERYLQAVYYENLFCEYFDDEVVHNILYHAYGDYSNGRFNIFGQLLQQTASQARYSQWIKDIGRENKQAQVYMEMAVKSLSQ